MEEEFRKNVGIVVCNKHGKVLLCERSDEPKDSWQFPQGGIDKGETPLQAAYRELKEETGLKNVELLAQYPEALRYRFSQEVLDKFAKLGRTNVGQEQYWFLFCHLGIDKEIDFYTHPEEIEFRAYEWVDIMEAPKRVVSFKREVYQKMAEYFEPYIKQKSKET